MEILAPPVAAIVVAFLSYLGFVAQDSDEPDCIAELKAAVVIVDQHPELADQVRVDSDVERQCKIKNALKHVRPTEVPPAKP
ncbi:hypothetical protein ACFVZT_23480 [Streptomyces sp. NPDC058321]|uniref:hypothetical protein n=1 Tax=Streptomyces sp. NPDC058321 TaxID=3346445 RepID=UPI0036E1D744